MCVAVAPDDVAANHRCLFTTGGVIGAVEVKWRNAWNWASIWFNHDEYVGVNRAAYPAITEHPNRNTPDVR